MSYQDKGSGTGWEPAEVVAFYRLLQKDPSGNKRLSLRLAEEGKGKWPLRSEPTIANMKVNWFGFSGASQTIDFVRAPSPPREDNPFWGLIGQAPVIRERKNKNKKKNKKKKRGHPFKARDLPPGSQYSKATRIAACDEYLSGTPAIKVAASYGMRDPSGIFRWMKDERFNPGLRMPPDAAGTVNAAIALQPPPPPTAPEAVAEPTTNGAPITQVTIDDGHDIKMTIPIHEHASTVIAKLMELSKQ